MSLSVTRFATYDLKGRPRQNPCNDLDEEEWMRTSYPVVVRESAPITTPPSNSTAIIDVYPLFGEQERRKSPATKQTHKKNNRHNKTHLHFPSFQPPPPPQRLKQRLFGNVKNLLSSLLSLQATYPCQMFACDPIRLRNDRHCDYNS